MHLRTCHYRIPLFVTKYCRTQISTLSHTFEGFKGAFDFFLSKDPSLRIPLLGPVKCWTCWASVFPVFNSGGCRNMSSPMASTQAGHLKRRYPAAPQLTARPHQRRVFAFGLLGMNSSQPSGHRRRGHFPG